VFRSLIESFVETYQQADQKHDRMRITRQIIAVMKHKYRSRFLKSTSKEKGQLQWEEISYELARDKVSHALRFAANSAGIIASSSSTSLSSISSSCVLQNNRSCRTRWALVGAASKADDHGFVTANSKTDEAVQNLEADLIFQRQQAIFESMCLDHDDSLKAANVNATTYNTVLHTQDQMCSEMTKCDLLELLDDPPGLSRSDSPFPLRPPDLRTLQSNDVDAMMREPLGMEGDLAILST